MEHVIGNFYREVNDGHLCILAMVGVTKFCLISLLDGNRWTDPIEIIGGVNNRTLSDEQFRLLMGSAGEFELFLVNAGDGIDLPIYKDVKDV